MHTTTKVFKAFDKILKYIGKTLEKYAVGKFNESVYCSPDGNDETGNGSEENPFFTIQRAVDSLGNSPNQCSVILKAGVYNYTTENICAHNSAKFFEGSCMVHVANGGIIKIIGESKTNTIINIKCEKPLRSGMFRIFDCYVYIRDLTFNFECKDTSDFSTLFYCQSTRAEIYLLSLNINFLTGKHVVYMMYAEYYGSIYVHGDIVVSCQDSDNEIVGATAAIGSIAINGTITIPENSYGVKIGNWARIGEITTLNKPYVDWKARVAEDSIALGRIIRPSEN